MARNHDHQEVVVPKANLGLSGQPMLSVGDWQLQPPVASHVKSGSGSVRVPGWPQIVTISSVSAEEESEEEEREENKEAELSPILPAKRQRGRPQPFLGG